MGDASIELWTISYNAGISTCEKGGQWQHAVSLPRVDADPPARGGPGCRSNRSAGRPRSRRSRAGRLAV
eukprot:2993183-Pyramimonas_sp.AAC.1